MNISFRFSVFSADFSVATIGPKFFHLNRTMNSTAFVFYSENSTVKGVSGCVKLPRDGLLRTFENKLPLY